MGRDSEVQRGSAGPRIRVRRLRLVCRGAGGLSACGAGPRSPLGRARGPTTPGPRGKAGHLKACFSKFRKLNVDSANRFWKY